MEGPFVQHMVAEVVLPGSGGGGGGGGVFWRKQWK